MRKHQQNWIQWYCRFKALLITGKLERITMFSAVISMRYVFQSRDGLLVDAGFVIERLPVPIPAGAVGEFSSPELLCVLTLIECPFHSHVTTVARKTPRSFCQKCS